jgi:hypothetical protein
MEASRGIQKYLSGKRKAHEIATKKKVISRYVEQIAADLADLSGRSKDQIKKELVEMIEKRYEQTGTKEKETEPETGNQLKQSFNGLKGCALSNIDIQDVNGPQNQKVLSDPELETDNEELNGEGEE